MTPSTPTGERHVGKFIRLHLCRFLGPLNFGINWGKLGALPDQKRAPSPEQLEFVPKEPIVDLSRLGGRGASSNSPLLMKFSFCVLILTAQIAHAGLEKYPSLLVADAKPNAPAPADSIRVTYLGVNGFQFEADGHVLLVDPYFTRVGFWPSALNQRIKSNPARVSEGLKHIRPQVDVVLVTHAHFDHLLDVPEIMQRTHARLMAGPTAVRLVESFDISSQQCESVKAGSMRKIGPWTIRVLAARHDRLFGKVPFNGKATSPQKPLKASDWIVGEPLAFLIQAAGKRIYIDSGGVPGAPPDARIRNVDLAILGVALPDSRERFAEAVRQLRPHFISPSHQDDMFAPPGREFVFGKLTNFPALVRDSKTKELPGRLILLDYFRPWTLP
jgi:L-ascorbate metabolism protein UlaG (beta-lactamase superfamily)